MSHSDGVRTATRSTWAYETIQIDPYRTVHHQSITRPFNLQALCVYACEGFGLWFWGVDCARACACVRACVRVHV